MTNNQGLQRQTPDHGNQVPQFVVDLGALCDGVRHFRTEQLPETLAQPVHRHLQSPFTEL